MSKFQELYNADIARYGGKPELYNKNIPLPLSQGRNSIICSYKIFIQSSIPILGESQRLGNNC